MAPQSFTDAAALSAALLTLRPRARSNIGGKSSVEVPGLGTLMWLCSEPGTGVFGRMEAVGIEMAEPLEPGQRFNLQAFVDLLPEELVPTKVSEAGQRIAFSFRVRQGHFRCRDCHWNDATDEKATYQGICSPCAEARREKYAFRSPEPETVAP